MQNRLSHHFGRGSGEKEGANGNRASPVRNRFIPLEFPETAFDLEGGIMVFHVSRRKGKTNWEVWENVAF